MSHALSYWEEACAQLYGAVRVPIGWNNDDDADKIEKVERGFFPSYIQLCLTRQKNVKTRKKQSNPKVSLANSHCLIRVTITKQD